MGLFHTILDFLFPSRCLECGTQGEIFCVSCLASCPEAERESARWVFALFDYRHPSVKRAIWLMKYKGKRDLAKIFAGALYGRILEEVADLAVMENFSKPLLVPIPLSGARKRERGFNQTELMAGALLELDKENKILELENSVLIKPRETPHQARIENRSERLKNIVGSFAVQSGDKVRGRNVILLDDVTTTGATLEEAKKVLQQAGARKVVAFTVAH